MKDNLLTGRLKLVLKSHIFKVFYSTGFTTGLKILASIVLSRIVAVRLGPSGLALLGQLTNFVTIALLLASGGFGNGIIKYISSLKNEEELGAFTRQSFKLTLLFSSVTGLVIIAGSIAFSYLNFNSYSYSFVFIALGLSIVFYASGNYFLSFVNGMADYKIFNWTNGINNILSLVVSVLLIHFYSLAGAFMAVAINQTVTCIVTIGLSKKYFKYFTSFLREKIELHWVKKLLSFSLMAFVTAVLTPVAQIIIRKQLIAKFNLAAAGEWEAINRISGLYLTVLINIMLVYYLPKLSSTHNGGELKYEIKKGFKFFVPIVVLLATCIFFCKSIIISLFLSEQFTAIKPFFLPQLLGDSFKILSFIYAYLVIAKAKVMYYIVSEILFIAIYVTCSLVFIGRFGTIGAVYAYMTTYILYFFFQLFITKNYILNEYSHSGNGVS